MGVKNTQKFDHVVYEWLLLTSLWFQFLLILGLDPAGPLFEGYDPGVRLDKTDADYVDVIHSNGDSLIVGGFGTWEPLGHVDFYPNGGRAQRGCQHLLIGGLYDFIYCK